MGHPPEDDWQGTAEDRESPDWEFEEDLEDGETELEQRSLGIKIISPESNGIVTIFLSF